jgi:hypothetical protein
MWALPGISSSGYLTAVYWAVYVNGVYKEEQGITVPSSDQNRSGFDDQAQPSSYQNVLVGNPYPGADSSDVAYTSGGGWLTPAYQGGTYHPLQLINCTSPWWTTLEDSNMEYDTPNCSPQSTCYEEYYPSSNSSITVNSVNQENQPITGYYTTITFGSNTVDAGYTPLTYTSLTPSDSYNVQVDNYGSCSFTKWSDGSTSDPRTIYAAEDQTLTAVYSCSGGATITIHSEDQNSNPITGYYTTLTGNGQNENGYTPVTFTGLIGDDYYSIDAENYGNCSFSHWGDTGSSNDPESILASGQTVIAYYDCT